MGFVGWRLTRPATAEALYGAIAESVEENGKDGLRDLADEIEEFLDRFPEHERAADVRAFADELELQRLERQLRVRARIDQNKPEHPAASIYAEAIAVAEANPVRAIELLNNLLALYKVGNSTDEIPEADRAYVILATRQLAILERQREKHAAELLPALQERLSMAQSIEDAAPTRAAKMYHALIDIYKNQPWAAAVVEQARARLKALGGE
jgi:hypothetical protein